MHIDFKPAAQAIAPDLGFDPGANLYTVRCGETKATICDRVKTLTGRAITVADLETWNTGLASAEPKPCDTIYIDAARFTQADVDMPSPPAPDPKLYHIDPQKVIWDMRGREPIPKHEPNQYDEQKRLEKIYGEPTYDTPTEEVPPAPKPVPDQLLNPDELCGCA